LQDCVVKITDSVIRRTLYIVQHWLNVVIYKFT